MEYYEETELRLGLPGHGNSINNNVNGGSSEKMAIRKRGFSETQEDYLKLNLGSKGLSDLTAEIDCFEKVKKRSISTSNLLMVSDTESAKPLPKAQVVGWPPVRSFRKNIISVQKTSEEEKEKQKVHTAAAQGGGMVKVSMDGAPYLRKVDLKMYNSYHQLSYALALKFFNSFTIGHQESQEIMNESKLKDLRSGNEYVFTYEDKDGDWMLVGDVPWKIFVESCKKLRLMKATDHAHRLEKCKERG